MTERQLRTVRASMARAPSKPEPARSGYRYSMGRKPADTRPTAAEQLQEAAQGFRLLQGERSAPASAPEPSPIWPTEPEPRTAAIGGAPEPVSPFGQSPSQHRPRTNERDVPDVPSIWDDHT